MRSSLLLCVFLVFTSLMIAVPSQAQQTTRSSTKKSANGYHRTSNTKAKPRAGAYARYDRSGRRNEDDMKLAPGLRLNMPSPPTTDYMGRPLKKKAPKVATSSATSMSSERTTPTKASPATTPKSRKR
ncbi:hypothetical protein [Hymenobacter volaticus]|uniref:Secreted protein n=1 Tax=Hymenobacter volaticus TaxID=2932254 RepID=A0ABY4G6V4_9BACT|nr:hypothetical protein [Hymenobacter volaticus]UOQ66502.1 hypothetical protein MUN86_00780 [Hymenobacter volaticus]